jgi:hypothetical protein
LTASSTRRNAALLGLAGITALVLTGCDNPSTQGAAVNGDPSTVFATLMQRPDIDKAAQQYQQMSIELRAALTTAIPTLASWSQAEGELNSACGSDYPGIGFNGQTRDLPTYVVAVAVTDAQWEQALNTVGQVAAKYGFDPRPQRLHDAPGNHDAIFHNVHDDGSITLDTEKQMVLGVSIACHLTAAAKKLGHLPPTS